MAQLPDDLSEQINAHCSEGDALAMEDQFEDALAEFENAWELLPEPRTQWEAALWILSALGDAHFFLEDWQACCDALMLAVKECAGAMENPFVRLRLGQSLFELGNRREAANWWTPAYLQEGLPLFDAEDPKYLTYLKSQLQPPPGGWPEGW